MYSEVLTRNRPELHFETGIVLSAGFARAEDSLLRVVLGQEGATLEAYAPSTPELDRALNGPLRVLTMRAVHGASKLPLLLVCEAELMCSRGFDHIPDSACPVEGVVLAMKQLVNSIKAPPLSSFVMHVFERRDVFQKFWAMPASARHHHAKAGGLAVHSLEVAQDLASHASLSEVERDLGIAGALLHDIGKVWSYTGDMLLNSAGRAMGHELIGLWKLEPELEMLESSWPDGAYAMRSLLSGQTRMRENGSLPSAILPRIKACDQRSCERNRMTQNARATRPVWTPRSWDQCGQMV